MPSRQTHSNHLSFAQVDLAALDPSLPDIPPWHAIRHVNFWLMLCSSTTVIGTGLLLLNNLTQLVLSLHGTATTAAIGASLFSVCNCLGRLWTGWASERMLHTRVQYVGVEQGVVCVCVWLYMGCV